MLTLKASIVDTFLMAFRTSYGKKVRFKINLILDLETGNHWAALAPASAQNFVNAWPFDMGEDLTEEFDDVHKHLGEFLTQQGFKPGERCHSIDRIVPYLPGTDSNVEKIGDIGYRV
jgi:hypothetical protein